MPETAVEPALEEAEPEGFRLLLAAELLDVRTVKLAAELFQTVDPANIELEFTISAGYRRTSDGFELKFDVAAPLEKDSEKVADFEIGIVTVYQLDHFEGVNEAAITWFIDRIGIKVVFPFIREALHSVASRLGLPSVTLGLFRSPSAGLVATVRGSSTSTPSN
ncbi:hypothetical protein [Actinoplanes sp. NPDC023714]|uniref:hypothetical protein n=1 Tax=Actinoplanes sp. NPDC023714 TaxID=3154322 RepID=UPI0033CC67F4